MQYTVRNIPKHVDKALRKRARAEGKSLNQVAIEVLEQALGGANGQPIKYRDLSDLAGTWEQDPEFDRYIREHDVVHPDDHKKSDEVARELG